MSGLEFPIRSLFEWTDETEDLIHPLLLGFKGGSSTWVARELMMILSEDEMFEHHGRDVIFLPAPASKNDHAFLLAQVMAELWNAPLMCPLTPVGDIRRQRDKSKEERKNRKFEIRSDMTDLIKNIGDPETRIIFVDDVITTGATVKAAFEALGKPPGFEAWSLVRRPRLATKQGF